MLCNGDSRVIYFWFRTVGLSRFGIGVDDTA